MQIDKIVVSAGRTFNHPFENYSNLKPSVTLSATLEPGDDADACIKQLQAKAEAVVEQHKALLLAEIKRLRATQQAMEEIANLEHSMRGAQARMEDLKRNYPEVFAALSAGESRVAPMVSLTDENEFTGED